MILILQNVACEGPGTIASYLSSHGFEFTTARLFEGTGAAPNLDNVSQLIVLGGSMNVYQQQEFPFLRTECRLLEEAIRRDLPTMGICLGAQLIAKVLVAKVTRAPVPEVGWYRVQLTAAAARDSVFRGLERTLRVFQWHEDTFDLPRGAVLLTRSRTCPNQAFRYAQNIYGLQFHIEVDGGMIDNWFEKYAPESPARKHVLSEYEKISATFRIRAEQLYDNFFQGHLKEIKYALDSNRAGSG